MGIFNTYSKTKKGLPDVYTYEEINLKLRTQIFHIWSDYISQQHLESWAEETREAIYNTICKEEGVKMLHEESAYDRYNNFEKQTEFYFEELTDCDKILDVIHITFYYLEDVEEIAKQYSVYDPNGYSIEMAIRDLNYRFRENGVGYEYSNRQIIRIDNKLLHKETIQPTLSLLSEIKYKNANDEFLKAHEHYKKKRNQECLNECLKSFESVMKIICKSHNWEFEQNDTAKPLINILIKNNFLPSYNESSLAALRQLLEGTIPTVRNKNSAHGAGTKEIIVPDYLANYMLYLTGATIQLLVETDKNRK